MFSCDSGEMSSRIQIDRPCVPATRSCSRGWMARSSTGTVGSDSPLMRIQRTPRSIVMCTPVSVPTNSTSGFFGSSRITSGGPPSGRSPTIDTQL